MHINAMNERFFYRRLDHFKEWLLTVKQHTINDVPPNIVEKVRGCLQDPNNVNHTAVRKVLQQPELYQYIEYSGSIYSKLKGIPDLVITPEVEEKLIDMFIIVNKAFSEKSGLPRKSFFPYHYLVYKFMEILGHPEHMEYYAQTTHPTKRRNNEDFFATICGDLHTFVHRSH